MNKDFAIAIITYKRPNNQSTYEYLRSNGYTGKVIFIVDNTDPTIDELYKNYVEGNTELNEIHIYDKPTISKKYDTGLSEPYLNFAVFSRNAAEERIKVLGYPYYALADDDIKNITCKLYNKDTDKVEGFKITNIDNLVDNMLDFMKSSNNIAITSPGQNIMFFDKHINEHLANPKYRECASIFFRNMSIDVEWGLNMLEDVITCYNYSRKGYVTTVIGTLKTECKDFHGVNAGGNTDAYKDKAGMDSIFPLIAFPDVFMIYIDENKAYSRARNSDNLSPMIISSKYRNY